MREWQANELKQELQERKRGNIMLPPEAIKEFQDLWLKKFGEEISETDADVLLTQLIQLFQIQG